MSIRASVAVLLGIGIMMALTGCGGGGGGGQSVSQDWPERVSSASSTLRSAGSAYVTAFGSAGIQSDAIEAAVEALTAAGATNIVTGEGSITFTLNGVSCTLDLTVLKCESGVRSEAPDAAAPPGAFPSNKKALVLSTEPDIFARMSTRVTQNWTNIGYQVDCCNGPEANVAAFARMSEYGAIFFEGHGCEGAWYTGQAVPSGSSAESDPEVLSLIEEGAVGVGACLVLNETLDGIALATDQYYYVTPQFIQAHCGTFPSSVVVGYTSLTMKNHALADAFHNKGAQVYVGWERKVNTAFDFDTMIVFLDRTAGGMTVQQAVEAANEPDFAYWPWAGGSASLTDEGKAIAASLPFYDDIEATLEPIGYQVTTLDIFGISSISAFEGIGAYAVNCAPGLDSLPPETISAIQEFVANGGKLYASDWAFAVVDAAFPGKVTFNPDPYIGECCTTSALVNDATLCTYLGASHVSVEFDLGAWVPIASVASDVTVLLSGQYQKFDYEEPIAGSGRQPTDRKALARAGIASSTASGPIAVSFSYGSGKVVYTSFHQHAQTQGVCRALMEYFALY